MSPTNQQLLCEYAERRSETAFAELVRRHVDLVYSAALRMVGDPHLAKDVTQSAFVALARSAEQLTDRPVLSGWLHRTAQNIAAQTIRTDLRRRAREQEAVAMKEMLSPETEAAWEHIAPQLDMALAELGEPDRDALLLRYFERKSAREMALTLGISDEAAQKRVTRAVERLRELFAKRGLTVGAGGLVVLLSASPVQAAPLGLAATITTAGTLAGASLATTATTATVTTFKTIAMTTFQKTLVTAALTAAVGSGIYEAHQASHLQTQLESLRQLQAPLAEQARQLQQQRDEATQQLADLRAENARLSRNSEELLKLRSQVAWLRQSQPAPAVTASLLSQPAETPASPAAPSEEAGRELGMAVVRGEPAAMQKVWALAKAEHDSFNTHTAGLNDAQIGDLSRKTFAPLQAAFAVISDAAVKGNPSAEQAVVQSLQVPELLGMGTQVLGALAGNGNASALTALLNYQKYGIPLASAVSALTPAANNGNQQAIELLAAVTQDPNTQPLYFMAADGLGKAAAGGNPLAVDTLISLAGSTNENVQTVALAGLRKAAFNQNARAAQALRGLGLAW